VKRLLTALLAALALVAVASTGASADQSRARSAPMLLGVMDDALLGNRLAGHAGDAARIAAGLAARGANPLVAHAFRPRSVS